MIESLPEYEHRSGRPLANASGHSCANLHVPICLVYDTRHGSPAEEVIEMIYRGIDGFVYLSLKGIGSVSTR